MREMIPWFRDRQIVRQLPLPYRLCAVRDRLAERTRIDLGGGFLFRAVGRAYEALGRTPVASVQVGDSRLFLDFRDRRVFWAVDELRMDTPESVVLRRLLAPGDTFLDIGANHGAFSLRAASLVGDEGEILAFEPQARLAALVRRSLQASGVRNFGVFELALSDAPGRAELHVPSILDHGSGSASLFSSYFSTGSQSRTTVLVSTLDACLRDRMLRGKVVIKLDVEGSELAVLRGARATIERYRPVIVFELNLLSEAAAGASRLSVLRLLGDYGYRRYAECDSFPSTVSASSLTDRDDPSRQRNIVALPD